MDNIKDIVIKMDCDFLIEKRSKKLESIKFDNNFPNVFKKNFIKDCEEYINILKAVADYTTTAKNLAYVIVFHKLYTNKEFDNETLVRLFDDIANTIDMSVEDLEDYLAYKEVFDFANLSIIINKYKTIDDYNHSSIRDRVIFGGLHQDVYTEAYNFFNAYLDEFIANTETRYDEYISSLTEDIIPMPLEEFKKSLSINGSFLIEEYYKSLNN